MFRTVGASGILNGARLCAIVEQMSERKLLEVTHFHLFTMPVVLLIVGHLFLATGLSDRAKPAPALVLDYGSTTLAPPGWKFRVDRAGNLLLTV